jgi:hypothetical protein
MARYNAQYQTSAALANGAFAWIGYTAVAARLRRCTVGVANSANTIVSQQCQVGINLASTGTPATPTAAMTPNPMGPAAGTPVAATNKLYSAWTTAPTPAAQSTDAYTLSFNDQLMGDLPWELLEEFWFSGPGLAAAGGITFFNRGGTLPTNHYFTLSVEWEE